MKKILCLLVSAIMLTAVFAGCGGSTGDRDQVLKVYNWADYIDKSVIEDFEADYNKKHGTNLTVDYVTFDTNETMLTKIEKGHEDYDLACPSDYMIQQMISKNLLKPIDITRLQKYQDNLSPFIKSAHKTFEGQTDTYSVGYMWGTMGILYNKNEVDPADIAASSNWELLWNPKYKNKVQMKDSVRDTFVVASIYANEAKLNSKKNDDSWDDEDTTDVDESTLSYNDYLTKIINDTSDDNIKRVKEALNEQKKKVNPEFEVDQGKNRMATGEAWIQLSWSGDATASIREAAENDIELAYFIPEVGSNLWFDGWVMPKYGKNQEAAYEFIDYLLTSDAAIKNMNEIGYTSGVMNSDIETWLSNEASETDSTSVDLRYLYADTSSAKMLTIPSDMLYPAYSEMDNLAIMKDFGDRTQVVMKMWSSIKTNTLAIVLIVVLSVIVAAGIAVGVVFIVKKKNKDKKKSAGKTNVKGYNPNKK